LRLKPYSPSPRCLMQQITRKGITNWGTWTRIASIHEVPWANNGKSGSDLNPASIKMMAMTTRAVTPNMLMIGAAFSFTVDMEPPREQEAWTGCLPALCRG